MSDVGILYELLMNETPFCFVKVNDGEMTVIEDENGLASRGAQQSSPELSRKMKEVLLHRQQNYFVGIPCSRCWSRARQLAEKLLNGRKENIMLANAMINTNVTNTMNLLREILPGKKITIVHSSDSDPSALKVLNIHFRNCISVPTRNGWDNYNKIKDLYQNLEKGEYVLFCCGPLGRVLAKEWFEKRPDVTCLELGSFFDPLTRGYMYLYQNNTLWLCPECNPTQPSKTPFDGLNLRLVHVEWCGN